MISRVAFAFRRDGSGMTATLEGIGNDAVDPAAA